MDIFLQQLINGLVLGSIYALVALGYTMVYGILGLINFAHGDIVMVGALVALTVVGLLSGSGLPPIVILLIALAAAVADAPPAEAVAVALAPGVIVSSASHLPPLTT